MDLTYPVALWRGQLSSGASPSSSPSLACTPPFAHRRFACRLLRHLFLTRYSGSCQLSFCILPILLGTGPHSADPLNPPPFHKQLLIVFSCFRSRPGWLDPRPKTSPRLLAFASAILLSSLASAM